MSFKHQCTRGPPASSASGSSSLAAPSDVRPEIILLPAAHSGVRLEIILLPAAHSRVCLETFSSRRSLGRLSGDLLLRPLTRASVWRSFSSGPLTRASVWRSFSSDRPFVVSQNTAARSAPPSRSFKHTSPPQIAPPLPPFMRAMLACANAVGAETELLPKTIGP